MKKSFTIIMAAALCLLAVSCKSSGNYLPNISGKAGEIEVVCTKGNWESDPGIALRSSLGGDFPYLPQSEPYYVLYNVPSDSFTGIFQIHRNIIFISVDSNLKNTKIEFKRNVWATPQAVVYITAPNSDELTKSIILNREKMTNFFDQAERLRLIGNNKKYEAPEIRTKVASVFGGSPYFPDEYSIKKQTENFMWISYETTYTNQGILIYREPYIDSAWAQPPVILKQMNEVLKDEVPGMREGSYMTISKLTPGYEWVKLGDKSFAEIRGLWEVENDYMGGPFVSHTFLDKDNQYVITMLAFVYAPKYDKRNYLRQVESIIYSFDWTADFPENHIKDASVEANSDRHPKKK
ncbi:MAG: DUF4837 family protein [Bacteroidales bacterium]|jgi:hypothetical protein|nr:DUF4837 family protein [Bacteroidales bacterium]MCI2146357.1 DUF4837 family protein [Bacteroidales bacterium]